MKTPARYAQDIPVCPELRVYCGEISYTSIVCAHFHFLYVQESSSRLVERNARDIYDAA
jgi:hypothetical protein